MEREFLLRVDTSKKNGELEDLYGIFFEDINHAADGGIYAEMVQNRSFEFCSADRTNYRALTAWQKVERDGKLDWMVSTREPFNNKNPHHLVLQILEPGNEVGIRNNGFEGGMYLEKGKRYRFQCYIKGTEAVSVKVRLSDTMNRAVAEESPEDKNNNAWKKLECILVAEETVINGHLEILVTGNGRACMDFISLMPEDTYKNRLNGLRSDLVEALSELKPRFMRFPGGCLVHDGELESDSRLSMYRWKNTIGAPEERPARRNNWNYNQTLGFGFYEYFLLCEDIGAQPLPVLPGGYNPHSGEAVPMDEMQEWVQDALDLIEFANGAEDTRWGAVRTALGHAKPFHLKYLAIGNEEAGEAFWARYPLFHKAVKSKYPEIQIINSAGPFSAGEAFDMGWCSAEENGSDYIDEHYYQAPEWMVANHHRYDHQNSKTKVFLGEYASCGNAWKNALAEASYMIGLERSTGVGLACYAPLFCNVHYKNWAPNLIWFDHYRVMRSVNYYVQKLFMHHQGCIRIACEGIEEAEEDLTQTGCYDMEKNPDCFCGDIQICGNAGQIEVEHVTIADCFGTIDYEKESGILEDGQVLDLGFSERKDFEVDFEAVQKGAGTGFVLKFGLENADNFYCLEFGGWANEDLFLRGKKNGNDFLLSQKHFHVETGRTYRIKVRFEGRKIQVCIDNQTSLDFYCEPFRMEKLYYTASLDSNGDVIVKIVNTSKQDVKGSIQIEGVQDAEGLCMRMGPYEDDAQHCLGKEEMMRPVQETVTLSKGKLPFIAKERSLMIYRMTQIAGEEN